MKRLVALATILVAIISANAELKLSVAATSEELNLSQASGWTFVAKANTNRQVFKVNKAGSLKGLIVLSGDIEKADDFSVAILRVSSDR